MNQFLGNREWQTTLPESRAPSGRVVSPVYLVCVFLAACLGLAHYHSVPAPRVVTEAYVAEHPFVGPPVAARRVVQSFPQRVPAPPPIEPQAELEAKMFPTRLHGPYALSVRDGLNEMVIETNLVAQGIEGVSTNAPGRDALLAAIPSHLPALGLVTSEFGTRSSPFTHKFVHHNGVDIAVDHGEPVFATADGIVTYAGWRKAFGRVVIINHGYGIVTKYAHNSRLMFKAGDAVRRGDVIALAGSTGRSTGSHVHYEVWVNGRAIDPTSFMFDVPERDGDPADQTIAMARLERAAHPSFVGPPAPRPHVGGDADSAMGGEIELSDAPEIGADLQLPRLDPRDQLGLNVAILSIFTMLSVMVVLLALPRDGYGDPVSVRASTPRA